MLSRSKFLPVIRGIELLLAEKRNLAALGPHFKIIHRFWVPGTICLPGEEILTALWVFRGREIPLRLSLSSLILFDLLARCRLPQSAAQIENALRSNKFYSRHAANGKAGSQTRMIKRRTVKVFIQRIRRELERNFRKYGVRIDPRAVLVSEMSDTNVAVYHLQASVEWAHL